MRAGLPQNLSLCERLAQEPFAAWRGVDAARQAVGVLCPCVPAELIHAAGFDPITIPPAASSAPQAEAHLPAACCGLARSTLEVALQGDLDFLGGMVLHRTCDTMAFLGDIWPHAVEGGFVATLNLPRAPEGSDAGQYLLAELGRLLDELVAAAGGVPPTPARWAEGFRLFDRRRGLLTELYRAGRPLSGWLRLQVVRTAFLLSPAEAVDWLEAIQGELAEEEGRALLGRRRVLLYGPNLADMALVKWVEDAGCWVVGDDLCSGWRTCQPLASPEPGEAPLNALVRWTRGWEGCPAQHRPSVARAARLLQRVEATSAEGVIFVLARFCDPYAFDYPVLAAALAARGIPHLLLESELTTPAGQVMTRVQAFLETLDSER